MPGSDARLGALESAKVGDKDLPQVIQNMVPYLIAVNNGKVAQANYYKEAAGDGTDPVKVANAQGQWNENFDPRLLEMNTMKQDPTALKKYVGNLSPDDKKELNRKYTALKQMGVMSPQ